MTDPRIDSYPWRGGREAMLRFGPDNGPTAILMLPLFEEANRCRAFAVAICRALAVQGIGSVLPDLPGQGESEVATERLTLPALHEALTAVPGSHLVAIRSGALLADARPCWLLAPQDGPSLLRELARAKGTSLEGERVEVAGNRLSRSLLNAFATAAHPGERRGNRTVRFAGDRRQADRYVDGAPLWRRAEPDNDPVLARSLAADIADWIAACEG